MHVRLQRILSKVMEGSVPRLTIPSLRTPGLSGPGLVAPSWVGPGLAAPSWIGPGLVVPSLFAPSWVGPGLAIPSVGPCLAAPHWKASGCVQIALRIAGIEAGILHKCRALLSHTVASPRPLVVLPSLTFHSLVLEPGFNLLIAKVQNGREFLHLLEAEVPLPLKPVPQRTQLGVREHGPDLLLPGVGLILRALFGLRSRELYGTVRGTRAVLRWWVPRGRARRADLFLEFLSNRYLKARIMNFRHW